MKNLDLTNHEDFQPCLNDMFTVKAEDDIGPELELIQVKLFGEIDPDSKTRQAFSLLFRGPMEPMLPQKLYQLENSKIGEVLLFLVPIGPDEQGMLYDANFN